MLFPSLFDIFFSPSIPPFDLAADVSGLLFALLRAFSPVQVRKSVASEASAHVVAQDAEARVRGVGLHRAAQRALRVRRHAVGLVEDDEFEVGARRAARLLIQRDLQLREILGTGDVSMQTATTAIGCATCTRPLNAP